jgi:Ca2+-binding RTX toxin-like protein
MALFAVPGLTNAQVLEAVELARASYVGEPTPSGWRALSESDLGFDDFGSGSIINGRMEDTLFITGRSPGLFLPPNFGAAQAFEKDGKLAISFRGTDFIPLDALDYSQLTNQSYILAFMYFLSLVAGYAQSKDISGRDVLIVGHSLGAGAANQLRDDPSIASGFFADSKYVTIASPLIAMNSKISNFGFDNDIVFNNLPIFIEEIEYASTTDNILLVEDSKSAFNGSENFVAAHSTDEYVFAVRRAAQSALNEILSPDSFAAFLSFNAIDVRFDEVLANVPKDIGVAYFGNGAPNAITGGLGLDFIDAGEGNDVLRGGDGPDVLIPGEGRDTAFVDAEDRIVGTPAELNGDEISIIGAGGAGLTIEILFPDSVARGMTSADVKIVGTSLRLDTNRDGVDDIVMTLTGATPTLSPGDVTNHPGGSGGRAATVVSLIDSTLGFVVDQPLNAGLAALGQASIGRLSLGGGASLIGPTGLTDFGLSAEVRNLAARDGRLFSVIEVDAGENTIINAPPFSGRGSRLGLIEFSPTTGATINRIYLPGEVGDVESVNALAPLPGGDFLAFGEFLPGRSTDRLRTLEGGADLIFRVSPSGTTTFITNLGDGAGTRIVSADTSPDGRVFAWLDFTQSYGGGRLLEVNPSTASAPTVFSYNGPNEITGISFDTSGALLAIGGDASRLSALFRISPDTGIVEKIRNIIGFVPEEFDATGMIPVPTSLAAVFAGAPLQGSAGAERLIGGPTGDSFVASAGNDTVDGGPGTDTVSFEAFASPIIIDLRINGTQTVAPGSVQRLSNMENVIGTAFGDYIAGRDGMNNLNGNAGTDTLIGEAGDDTLDGGPGSDSMAGGSGDDQYLVDDADDTITEDAGQGTDTAWVSGNGWTQGANIEITRLYGAGTLVNGSGGNDIMVANAGAASLLNGGDGDDVLWGGSAAHTLMGGAGDDVFRAQDGAAAMIGGPGDDQFVVGHISATITELAGDGTDTAWLTVNDWTNFPHVEIVRLVAPGVVHVTGADTAEDLVANQAEASRIDARGGNDVLWGSAFADTLNGEAGDDIMRGRGGADVMAGGEGHDQYVVVSSAATVTEAADAGYDIVYFAGTGRFVIGENVEEARLFVDGTGLVGNALANLLVGNNAGLASMIDGAGGADTMWGTAAADTLIGGAGDDVIYSQGGADRILYDATGWGYDQVAGFAAGEAKIQFAAGSGVTQFSQLFLNSANGNTQVEFDGHAILVFGMASMTASDFIFG